jgi:anti-sigma factor RsiW
MTTPIQSKAVPTDLELMAYFDGELDGERAVEVERYLEAAEPGRQKLDGLTVLSTWVRAHHTETLASGSEPSANGSEGSSASLGEGFTDAIMARLESENASTREAAELPRLRSTPAVAPANDNARLLWGLVAAAAVAAAGLFFWGKGVSGLDESQIARAIGAPVPSVSSAPVAAAPSGTAAVVESDDESTGMEIAAVDFGAATGAIYYVPKGDNLVGAATTTVVWLADE